MTISGSQQTDLTRDEFYRCYICRGKCDFFVTLGVHDFSADRNFNIEFQACSGHIGLVNSKMIGTTPGEYYDETRDLLV